MEFDETKVYTALTADAVEPGSKGYFYDSLFGLEEAVKSEEEPQTVKLIRGRNYAYRFIDQEQNVGASLFYLVEEPKKKKLRPYKDINEMVDDFTKSLTHDLRCRPVIYVRNKNSGSELLIVGYYKDNTVGLLGTRRTMFELSEYYEYLDGSPCGIMEE